jgi:hypothetical protein
MIKLAVLVDKNITELTMEGEGSKQELFACIGLLEDLKHKILASTQDDGSSIMFTASKKRQ